MGNYQNFRRTASGAVPILVFLFPNAFHIHTISLAYKMLLASNY